MGRQVQLGHDGSEALLVAVSERDQVGGCIRYVVRLHADDHLRQAAGVEQQVQMGPARGLQPLPGLVGGGGGVVDGLDDALDPLRVGGQQDLALGGEVRVDRAHGDADGPRDVADRGGVIAALRKQLGGGHEDALAPAKLRILDLQGCRHGC